MGADRQIRARRADVTLRPYAAEDLGLLTALLGDAEAMRFLGGPESGETLAARHARYLAADPERNGLFTVLVGETRVPAGWVGFWESEWAGEPVWEIGWHVLPALQGTGVAFSAGLFALDEVRQRDRSRWVVAFPSIENSPSNALCRALGFAHAGVVEIEYPPGRPMLANHWRLDLLTDADAPPSRVRILTPRLHIREWRDGDLSAFRRLMSAPEVAQWSGSEEPAEQQRPFVERMRDNQTQLGWALWAVELREPDASAPAGPIGYAGFGDESPPDPELAWTFDPAVWGRGLATEAGVASRDFGFGVLGMARVVSVVDRRNAASTRVAEKVGLHRAGTTHCHAELHDVFALTAEEWRAAVATRPPA